MYQSIYIAPFTTSRWHYMKAVGRCLRIMTDQFPEAPSLGHNVVFNTNNCDSPINHCGRICPQGFPSSDSLTDLLCYLNCLPVRVPALCMEINTKETICEGRNQRYGGNVYGGAFEYKDGWSIASTLPQETHSQLMEQKLLDIISLIARRWEDYKLYGAAEYHVP